MKWDNLTMSQKQALMKIYVNNGVTNLDEIVNHYNRYAEGGPKEVTEPPTNTVMYSRTPRELVGNVVNTRPVPGLITMTEVPRIGAGVNMPITEAINNIIARRTDNNTNVVRTDSIVTRRPVSYIGMPTRINRFDDGGIKDTWKPQYWFTPEYKADSLKEAIYSAYNDGRKGKNIIYNGKAYKAELNQKDENQYNKEKQWEKNRSITPEQVVDTYIDKIMWTMENPNNTGYNPKNKKYYVYKDSALDKNIGPGIAYTSETGKDIDYNKGYTKKELNELIRPELLSHMNEIENQLHSKYGESVDTMSLGNRLILLDIAHNVRPKGSKKANMPVTGYPTLTKSMMTGNSKLAKRNTNSGSSRRQNMRNSLLWVNDFDDFILENK
jgi:hypothetical protein